jgi:hypothetical protein
MRGERNVMHTVFKGKKQKERNHYEDLNLIGKAIIKWTLEK